MPRLDSITWWLLNRRAILRVEIILNRHISKAPPRTGAEGLLPCSRYPGTYLHGDNARAFERCCNGSFTIDWPSAAMATRAQGQGVAPAPILLA